MNWKKRLLRERVLYVIIDKAVLNNSGPGIIQKARALAGSGADVIQFRFNDTRDRENLKLCVKLREITRKAGQCFIVNNRVDMAYFSDADGVHLGTQDCPIAEARRLLGKNKIIGRTTHSLRELKRFALETVDYLSFGPLFTTPLKPHLRAQFPHVPQEVLRQRVPPVIFIGGIQLPYLPSLVKKGIRRIAVCRDILLDAHPSARVGAYRACLQ